MVFLRKLVALAMATAVFVLASIPANAAPAPVKFELSKLTAKDFGQLPFIELARLSPDGRRVAGLLGIKGEQRIAIFSLFDPKQKSIQLAIPDKEDILSIRWVNDDFIIATVDAQQNIEGDLWYVSRLFSVDTRTGKATRLLWNLNGQNASDVVWLPSDGSSAILVAAQNSIYTGDDFWPAVYRVDVSNGHYSMVQHGRSDVMNWWVDAAGRVRAGVAYEDSNRRYRMLYRGESGANFHVVDKADARKRESLLEPVLFVPGTDHALVVHDDNSGATGVYETDLMTQDDVRTVYTAPEGSEIEYTIVSRDGATLLGVDTSGNDEGVHWLDPSLASLQSAFDRAVPGRSARIVSFNADRTRMLVRVDRPDSPGLLYYFNVNDGRLQKVAAYNEALGLHPLSPVKSVTYKARDGTPIEAILTLPAGRDPHMLPIVMMPHGGPWAHDSLAYDYWAQFLASRGYVVMQPNFRGSDGFGTRFMRMGEGQMGLAMQDDISDGLKWAVAQGIADPRRACIAGASYGGYAAMWGIAKDPGEYRCAISIAGVSSLRKEVNSFGISLTSGLFKDEWQRMTPDFAAVSPINAIDRIKAPLLLIHGDKDARVDVSQSRKMYAKMRHAGKTVQFVELPKADHNFGREEDRVALLKAMASFLARYNPAGPASAPTATKTAAAH